MKTLIAYLISVIVLCISCQAQSNPNSRVSSSIELERPAEIERVVKSDDEWKEELNKEQYYILRTAGTERPGTSPLLQNKEKGTYVCAGCGLPLFTSDHKFNSGTGWPSFYDELDGHVLEKSDYSHGMMRTEILCARCDGHLGHVFSDGPEPTGLRYCVNGVSLHFEPDTK